MKYVVISETYKGVKTKVGTASTVSAARKKAYSVIKDENLERCMIYTEGNVRMGEVLMHHAGFFEGKRFFYPDYRGYYKGSKSRWTKYFLKSDGSLGKGTW